MAADIQAWMTSVGVLLTAVVAAASWVQSYRNGRALSLAKVGADSLHDKIVNVEIATNGMKKELEEKAFLAGARSTDGTETATDLVTRATETAAIAARVVADAAKTAADLALSRTSRK